MLAGLAVAKVIRSGQGLQILELAQNRLGDIGIAGISGALLATSCEPIEPADEPEKTLPFRLQRLDVSSNQVTELGLNTLCNAISTAIEQNQNAQSADFPLKELLLAYNRIGDEGAKRLAKFWAAHSNDLHVESLDVSHNNLSTKGLTLLLNALSSSGRALSTIALTVCCPFLSHVVVSCETLV